MKIAVDVALLLPEKINRICIGINAKKDSKSFFNGKNNHPHITLALGAIDEKDIPKAVSMLARIAKEFPALRLETKKIGCDITPNGKESAHFAIEPNEELSRLRKQIMTEFLPFFSYKIRLEMFCRDPGEKLNGVSKYWVENYGKKFVSGKKHHPHISLKCGKAECKKIPIRFRVSKIALCRLGNYCACREILASVKLEKKGF